MNKSHLITDGLFVIGVLGVSLSLFYFLPFQQGQMKLARVGCNGTDYFHTGVSFDFDAGRVIRLTEYNASMPPMSPAELWVKGRGDCEAISNAIYCLSQRYNVTCSFYTLHRFDTSTDNSTKGFMSHLGIKCLMDGYWVDYY